MGMFDKVKGLFYEESEEEAVIETEEVPISRVEANEEEKEDEMDDVISERDLFKSEPTFKFPIMFEDEELDKVQKEKHLNIMDKYKEAPKPEVEEVPHFRPTPIVSPVYGVLDKHYEKDHMPDKAKGKMVTIEKQVEENVVNIDQVRKKAFGTLADDLEKTMSDETQLFDSVELNKEEADINVLEETTNISEEISLEASKVTIGDAEENFDDFGITYDSNKLVDEKKDDSKEDLFEMIDSMYDKTEEEK